MRLTTLLILSAISALTALARLGETPAQIQARYGAPVIDPHPGPEGPYLFGLPTTNYLFKEYSIYVSYKDNRSVSETITAIPPGREITVEESKALVASVTINDGKWENTFTNMWANTATGGLAMRTDPSTLAIESGIFLKQVEKFRYDEEQKKIQKETDKAKGF